MRQATQQSFQRGKDRILGGVCSGLAAGFHIDPLWVRLGFVLLAFLQGVGLLIYIVLWLVMPEQVEGQEGTRSGFDSMSADIRRIGAEFRGTFGGSTSSKTETGSSSSTTTTSETSASPTAPLSSPAAPAGRQSIVLGAILVVVGVIILGANTGLVQWSIIWPAVLIVLGALLLARTIQRRG